MAVSICVPSLSQRRNTIRQDLKSQPFRRLFVDELYKKVIPPSEQKQQQRVAATYDNRASEAVEFERRASLTWEQFDVIVGLLDEALRYEGMSYNTVIAPLVMDLTTRMSTVAKLFLSLKALSPLSCSFMTL